MEKMTAKQIIEFIMGEIAAYDDMAANEYILSQVRLVQGLPQSAMQSQHNSARWKKNAIDMRIGLMEYQKEHNISPC